MKKLLIIIVCLLTLPISISAAELSTEEYNKMIDALMETAQAYHAQGKQIQYDSYRKNLYATPEDATSRNTVYTVCSGFIYMSYYQSLGVKIPDSTDDLLRYGFNYKYTGNTIFYYNNDNKTTEMIDKNIRTATKALGLKSTSDTLTKDKKQEFINSIIDDVKPGDIYVYKRETGHAMMVKKVDKDKGKIYLMEGDGGRYDYIKHVDRVETSHGAVYDNIDMMDRLYADSVELTMIRIVNPKRETFPNINSKGNEYKQTLKVTSQAESRIRLQDINIGKIMTEDVHNQKYAQPGSLLTYQLKITNESTKDYGIFTVAEYIDESMVEIVDDAGGTKKNKDGTIKQLVWEYSGLKAGKSIIIKYTVKVKNDKTLIGKIYTSTGRVSNIPTSKIETLIGNRLTREEKKSLKVQFENLTKDSKYTASSGVKFIQDLYDKALGINLGLMITENGTTRSIKNNDFLFYKDEEVKSDTELVVRHTLISSKSIFNNIKKYIYGNYYGIRLADKSNASRDEVKASFAWNRYPVSELHDRARVINKETLENGDIILAYIDKTATDKTLAQKAYIYLDEALYRYIPKTKELEVIKDTTKSPKLTNFLNNLVGDNYVILRPYVQNSLKSISVSDVKLNYTVGDKFDNRGYVILNYEDGTTEKIELKNTDVKVSGFSSSKIGEKEITVEYKYHTHIFKVIVNNKQTTSTNTSFGSMNSVYSAPLKTRYIQGDETLDLTGGSIVIQNEDGTTNYVSMKNENVVTSILDTSTLGTKEIIVKYKDITQKFYIEVVDKKIQSISVNSLPMKQQYILNSDSLDLTGGVLLVTFEDGTTDLLSMTNEEVNVSGFDNTKEGKNTLILEYETLTCNLDINIINKKIKSIEMNTLPYILTYNYKKDNLDLSNATLLITYEDETTERMNLDNENVLIEGFDNTKLGKNTLVVKYKDLLTTFDIEVIGEEKIPTKEQKGNTTGLVIIISLLVVIIISIIGFVFYKKKKVNL